MNLNLKEAARFREYGGNADATRCHWIRSDSGRRGPAQKSEIPSVCSGCSTTTAKSAPVITIGALNRTGLKPACDFVAVKLIVRVDSRPPCDKTQTTQVEVTTFCRTINCVLCVWKTNLTSTTAQRKIMTLPIYYKYKN